MNEKKYRLGDQDPETGLYRIVALRSIPRYGICAGDVGGLVASEQNLSQDGDCWIADDARVSGSARVFGSALVSGSAQVYGSAHIYGTARVSGSAQVSGSTRIFESARVSGSAQVYGSARVSESAMISGSAYISGLAEVYGSAQIYKDARVFGVARISGSARISGGHITVGRICGDAVIERTKDVIHIEMKPFPITVTPQNVTIGCQTRTIDEWLSMRVSEARALFSGLTDDDNDFYRLQLAMLKQRMWNVS